ncbi:SUKH-4 family immunity protein [Streptomyces macrosporus]|uniref:SUKH-4 family immunity protein n=1 Tax=Streptomyces macrosporus TaxID=44032 RepID=A0ABN3K805_9ACTN
MSNVRFSLTHEEIVSVFGAEQVSRSDRNEAEDLGLSGPTLEFLCTVGLPRMPKAEISAPHGKVRLRDLENASQESHGYSEEILEWIILGNLPGSTLALDPVTGIVHGSYDDFETHMPLHSDVSSLAYTVYAVKRILPEVAAAADQEERDELVDGLQRFIAERDPLPFADEDSEWNGAFDEIAMGMWT